MSTITILCTRPHDRELDGEAWPHQNEIPRELLYGDDTTRIQDSRENATCKTCGMPLILKGRYIPTELLGKGGYGETYLAYDLAFRDTNREPKKCAIKRFRHERFSRDSSLDTAKRMVEQEVNILRELNHPLIPRVFAPCLVKVGQDSRRVPAVQAYPREFYLSEAYIEGVDLGTAVQENGTPFSEDKVKQILEDILDILKSVHGRGIIHRDIKPANIIYSKEDHRYHLIDFGVVKVNDEINTQDSQNTLVFRDDGFKPPEQLHGGDVSEPSSDLYALAATCVSLLTGKHRPNSDFEIPDNLSTWHERLNIDSKLINILNKMMQPLKQDRYQSAKEVLKALEALEPSSPPPWKWLVVGAGVTSIAAAALVWWLEIPPTPIQEAELPNFFSRGEQKLLALPSSCNSRDNADEAVKAFNAALENSNVSFQPSIEKFEEAFRIAGNPSLRGEDCKFAGDPEALIYAENGKALQRARDTGNPPLTIAVTVPIAGSNSAARQTLYGVAQAQHNFNNNRTTEDDLSLVQVLIVRDDNPRDSQEDRVSSPEVAQQLASYLVENNIPDHNDRPGLEGEILGMIGHFTSDATKDAGQVYQNKLPAISPVSTAVRDTPENNTDFKLNPWYLRTAPDDAHAANQVFSSIRSQLDPDFQAYILFDKESDYSRSSAQAYRDEIENAGGSVGQECNMSSATCPPVGDEQVVVLVPSSDRLETAINLIQQFGDLSDKVVLGGDAMYEGKVLTEIGDELQGMRLGVAWHRDLLEDSGDLKQELNRLWGTSSLEWVTASSYDATQALIKAIDRAFDDGNISRSEVYRTLTNNLFEADGFMDSIQFNRETGERILAGTGVGVVVEIDKADGPNGPCTAGELGALSYCLSPADE